MLSLAYWGAPEGKKKDMLTVGKLIVAILRGTVFRYIGMSLNTAVH
jgi:hypothetical protein